MNKFKIGDKVGTKLEMMEGFDNECFGPSGLKRLRNLEVIKITPLEITEESHSRYSEPWLYECKSKSRTYFINQCFLEAN